MDCRCVPSWIMRWNQWGCVADTLLSCSVFLSFARASTAWKNRDASLTRGTDPLTASRIGCLQVSPVHAPDHTYHSRLRAAAMCGWASGETVIGRCKCIEHDGQRPSSANRQPNGTRSHDPMELPTFMSHVAVALLVEPFHKKGTVCCTLLPVWLEGV